MNPTVGESILIKLMEREILNTSFSVKLQKFLICGQIPGQITLAPRSSTEDREFATSMRYPLAGTTTKDLDLEFNIN